MISVRFILGLLLIASCQLPKALADNPLPQRIISLAPHTTEWVYALGAEDRLIAVSEFSDFPSQAAQLPTVANHNGVDFEAILRLKPDLVLAWEGGNKPQDLARLASLGLTLFSSSPRKLEDIPAEIASLADVLGVQKQGLRLETQFNDKLTQLQHRYGQQSGTVKNVFYYLWPKPLMTIGQGAWANQLLETCGASNVFRLAPTPYPSVTLEQVIRHKPDVLVAAMQTTTIEQQGFWQGVPLLAELPILQVNPDLLHRFTPRILSGLENLCQQLHAIP